jgi:hypothetical protein
MSGSGTRLREAVRIVTDGTLGLLSRNLQNNPSFAIQANNNHDLAIKSPHRRKSSATPNHHGYPSYNNTFSEANGNNTNYVSQDNQITHQPTPYPTATQYSNYPDPTTNNNSLTYTAQDHHSHTQYTTYPTTSSDSVEAPLLAAFAAQAAATQNYRPVSQQQQVQQNHHGGMPLNSNSLSSGSQSFNSGSQQSWQQWTHTMAAGNLEPQDRYSASALMQLGGRDLGLTDGGSAAPLADMGSSQAGVGVLAGDGNGLGGGIGNGGLGNGVHANPGIAWPLNIFDINHGNPN